MGVGFDFLRPETEQYKIGGPDPDCMNERDLASAPLQNYHTTDWHRTN